MRRLLGVVTTKVIKIGTLGAVGVNSESSHRELGWAGLLPGPEGSSTTALHRQLRPDVLFTNIPGEAVRHVISAVQCPRDYQLQVYLSKALDICDWKILSEVLFPESNNSEEYFESQSELRQKGYEQTLERAKRHMQDMNN
ncbi:hypothetical protein NQZ68_010219 [Scomber scombrus]|uniref:Uncharacterized protein n=1 Tax=Scomber scombrus TaxID=13677 RepID=A0AAV1NZ93_SCOSC